MAGSNRAIGATLSLKDGNFFTNMKSAVSASNKLKNSLNGTNAGTKNFGNTVSKTGGVLKGVTKIVASVTAACISLSAAVNFGKDVVNTGMEFEQGMANVSAISGATGAELTALSDKAKQMGATT